MMLPITKYRNDIIEAVRNHSYTIISAETGSGKSTQIPQYLSQYYNQIIVTEPRIMAAKTLARRVSEEMNATLGEEVGYMTAYDKCYSNNTNILYCTDGLQLIRSIFSKDNETEKVLIIDEVHEWNLNIETLVGWCKFMQKKWNTKVVIMSATMETDELSNYFGQDVAVLNIPGSLYEVSFEERPSYKLINTIRENVEDGKNILVFVAGKREIYNLIEELEDENAMVLPLHGEMDWADQKRCFEQYGIPKVIVATNVAQTSITIPDIDVVVDSGEARISIAEEGIQGLYLKSISQSDIFQRKGRAGRTKNGKYFLCSDKALKERIEYTIPEIQRSILDRVVLQLATIGLDAEELEFFHQPSHEAIKAAKKELAVIGALSDNRVTKIGQKIVKMPVSVQLARMIVEAEKFGCVEQVMIIATIIEMGGLLAKEGDYRAFTCERKSDLLAELDVWNTLNQMKYIDFSKLGIKKKSFFKMKEHLQKLRETLYGIVKITNQDNRDAVLKSCLCGLVSNIYVKFYNKYMNEDGTEVQLDRKSCLSGFEGIIIGIPKTIQYRNCYGWIDSLNLVSFASKIDASTLMELVPDKIVEEKSFRYSASMDALEITTKKRYACIVIDTEVRYDRAHPKYEELKTQYQEELKSYSKLTDNDSKNQQEMIVIDGKMFKVHYDFFDKRAIVYLDNETLFTTNVKEVALDSGEKVIFCSESLYSRKETNIIALRNAVEMNRINRLRERMRHEYESLKASNIDELTQNADKLGKIVLTMNNGGYGDEPLLVYGYITLKKNTVAFKIGDDEEIANSNTLEALQFLFYKEIQKRYSESKFSHQMGKKKKILTPAEKEVKKDFDSLVRESLVNITIENVLESLEFLEEYYQELMK